MPTPPLYTIDEALCSKRGTLNDLNASLLEPALIPTLPPILPSSRQAPLRQAPSRQALTTATPLPVSAVDWERIKKFRSILQAEHMETYSCCKERWFQIGLATEGDNIDIYKAYIKDTNSFKDPTLPPLFSKSNRLNLGPILGFLPILTAVQKLLIVYIYIYLQVVRVYS